jgi:hypothetical protein
MKTFSNVANQCQLVPTGAAIRGSAAGDCTYPFRSWGLNRFWVSRSGMKTFSNVANECQLVPTTVPTVSGFWWVWGWADIGLGRPTRKFRSHPADKRRFVYDVCF